MYAGRFVDVVVRIITNLVCRTVQFNETTWIIRYPNSSIRRSVATVVEGKVTAQ
jgi:hypothetical protein